MPRLWERLLLAAPASVPAPAPALAEAFAGTGTVIRGQSMGGGGRGALHPFLVLAFVHYHRQVRQSVDTMRTHAFD